MPSRGTTLKIIFNTLLGALLVYIWLQFVDLKEIISQISEVKLLNLVPVFLFMLASPVLRAVRLKIFLYPIKNLPLKDLIFLNGAAMMLNFLIPIRAGEIAKGVYLNNQYDLSLGKSLVWVFLDRFVDFLTVLMIASVLLLLIPTNLPATLALTLIIIFILVIVVVYLMIYKIDFARKMFKFLQYLLIVKIIKIYFEHIYEFFLDTFAILRRTHLDIGKLFLVTILAYVVDAAIWYSLFIALHNPQSYIKMYLGQLLSALTYLIPAAPGYVGSAEASGLLILSGVFGIGTNLASSMIVLFHVASALFVIIFGIISIYSLKIDLGLVLKKVLRKS